MHLKTGVNALSNIHSPRLSNRQFRLIVINLLVHLESRWTAAYIQLRGICVRGYFMVHEMVVTLVASVPVTGSPASLTLGPPMTCLTGTSKVRLA